MTHLFQVIHLYVCAIPSNRYLCNIENKRNQQQAITLLIEPVGFITYGQTVSCKLYFFVNQVSIGILFIAKIVI